MDAFMNTRYPIIEKRFSNFAKSNLRKCAHFIYFLIIAILHSYLINSCDQKKNTSLFYMHFFFIIISIYKSIYILYSIKRGNGICFLFDIFFYRGLEPVLEKIEIILILIDILYYSMIYGIINNVMIITYSHQDTIPIFNSLVFKNKTILFLIHPIPCLFEFLILMIVLLILKQLNHKFKLYKYEEYANIFNGNNLEVECIICKESFENDTIVKMLRCRHIFHTNCIDQWFKVKKTCPLCNISPLEVDSIKELLGKTH